MLGHKENSVGLVERAENLVRGDCLWDDLLKAGEGLAVKNMSREVNLHLRRKAKNERTEKIKRS